MTTQPTAQPTPQPTPPATSSARAAEGLYLFGVAPAGVEIPPDCHGVGVSIGPVATVRHGRIEAIVNPLSQVRALGSRQDLLNHSAVLNRIAQATTVLPARFGMVLPSRNSLVADLLQPRHDQIDQALTRLANTAQFTMQVQCPQNAVLRQMLASDPEIQQLSQVVATTGRYQDRLRLGELVAAAMTRRRAELVAAVHATVRPHARAGLERPVPADDLAVSMAFLVDDANRNDFLAAAERLAAAAAAEQAAAEHIGAGPVPAAQPATVRLVGPTAPYDFAEPALGGQL